MGLRAAGDAELGEDAERRLPVVASRRDRPLSCTGLGEERMRKRLWENPVRFFGES